ncbi:MAG TPA: hypothetical protein VN723_02215 [Rhizomicrobium sp.]|nr:hypothetical protein [Rhizomicrobium sp.]
MEHLLAGAKMVEESEARRAPLHFSVLGILLASLGFWAVIALIVSEWL